MSSQIHETVKNGGDDGAHNFNNNGYNTAINSEERSGVERLSTGTMTHSKSSNTAHVQ